MGTTVSLGEVKTEHEGRGRGLFQPEAGQKYELFITNPAGKNST